MLSTGTGMEKCFNVLWSAAFGTYVLAAVDVSCKVKEVVIFNPKKEVLILVILTWAFQLLILCGASFYSLQTCVSFTYRCTTPVSGS